MLVCAICGHETRPLRLLRPQFQQPSRQHGHVTLVVQRARVFEHENTAVDGHDVDGTGQRCQPGFRFGFITGRRFLHAHLQDIKTDVLIALEQVAEAGDQVAVTQ